jgi:hypothetical protein
MNEAATINERKELLRLLRLLGRGNAVIAQCNDGRDDGKVDIDTAEGRGQAFRLQVVERAAALGLVSRNGNELTLAREARAFLRRAAAEKDEAFLAQHGEIESGMIDIGGERQAVRINLSESPLGPLSRLKDRDGSPFLPAEALAAGEHLASDFTRAQLQPRVTASWEPRLSSHGKGGRGGMADLTDSAVASRLAVNRAIEAMGPELSGVALDVCCFMKGLETVERERQWPARSAKLMLRTALMALSRHYAPPPRRAASMQHWGTQDYRPELGR